MHTSLFAPIHTHTCPYTYEIMEKDITALLSLYPDLLQTEIVTCSLQGRAIYDIIFGNPDAPSKLLVQAGIHGREWLNCLLVMMELSALCQCLQPGSSHHSLFGFFRKRHYFRGVSYEKLFHNVCVHILPMSNPDGVTISQTTCPLWKANARGVNLNSNFQAGFSQIPSTDIPHFKDYKGEHFHSEIESKALVQLTKILKPNAVISYHETGSLIYANYGQSGTLKKKCRDFTNLLSSISGYPVSPEYAVSGGYSDWCVRYMQIPACTIETGTGIAPVSYRQLPSIWKHNRLILPAAAFSILLSGTAATASPVPAEL